MEKSMPGDDHRRRVNRTLAVGVDGRRGSNFMAMAFVCWGGAWRGGGRDTLNVGLEDRA